MGERGISAPAIAAVVVVVILVAGAGYFLFTGQPGPSGGPADGGAEEMGIPIYSGATGFSVPSELKSGLGITVDVTCEGYTTSAGAEDVMGWYKNQMDDWTLMSENVSSPPDKPGTTIYMQHYKKGENGAFILAMNDPQMGGTILAIVTGSWSSIQGIGGVEGEGPPEGGGEEGGQQEGEEGEYPELGTGPITFAITPIDEDEITSVEPLGNLNPTAGHTFPSDHGSLGFEGVQDVRAPADGIITGIQIRSSTDYKIIITCTNTFQTYLDHLTDVEDFILEQADPTQEFTSVKIPVEAGQIIGKAGGEIGALDWGVIDEEVTLNFIHPERYGNMAHSRHFIPYCEENLKSLLLEKLDRTAEPRWGKIDFDQPGKLVGNWFHESIGDEDPLAEWDKHLAFVYSMWDPTQIRIAVGGILDVPGEGKIYQVVGNSPDPADVSVESGMVTYRLRGTAEWGEESVTATIIVQLVENERIKVEGFSGHPSDPQFTSNAQYYVR